MSMNLEEIMKPYFDRQAEIKNNYEVRKNSLRLQLERIRDNKESEIAEYIQNAVLDGRDFYAGYSAMIREDLERSYAQREAELENEIANVDKYYRVDVREAIEIKGEIRKSLLAARKELELNIMEAKIQFDTIMFKLKTFKYVYDENHRVLNGDEFKALYDESNRLIEVKYSYESQLKKLDEYLNMTELTEEEIKIGMMSMTPWEKEEYDRRKSLKANEEIPQFDLVETLKNVAKEKEEEIDKNNKYIQLKIEEAKEKDKQISNLIHILDGYANEYLEEDLKKLFEEFKEENSKIKQDLNKLENLSLIEKKDKLIEIINKYSELEELLKNILVSVNEKQNVQLEEDIFEDEDIPFGVTEEEKEIEEDIFEDEEEKDDIDFEVVEPDELPIEEEQEELTPEEVIAGDLIDSSLNVDNSKVKFDENDNVIAESYNDLLQFMFSDIAEEAKNMRSIKIYGSKGELSSNSRYISTNDDGRYEEYVVKGKIQHEDITLPNGEFVNQKDIYKAIENYRKANKGRTFIVNGKEYEVTRKTARDLKKVLKHCTTITLLNEKKITEFDMKRVIGKNMTEDGSKIDLGRVATDLPKGDYINANEFLANLRNLFEEKKTSWFKKTWEKMRTRHIEKEQVIEEAEVQELEEEDVKVR